MKYIINGIRDYIKDCRHDRLYTIATREYDQWIEDDVQKYAVIPAGTWKEGSIWHYIRQRKIGAKIGAKKKPTPWRSFDYIKTKQELAEALSAAVDEVTYNGATSDLLVEVVNDLYDVANKKGWLK